MLLAGCNGPAATEAEDPAPDPSTTDPDPPPADDPAPSGEDAGGSADAATDPEPEPAPEAGNGAMTPPPEESVAEAPPAEPPAVPPPPLRVHFVDVGQGDAVVWELPDGALVLYDCGDTATSADTNPVVRYLETQLQKPRGSRLHALVSSHGHLDHVGGCEEVLAEYAFDHVYEAWFEGATATQAYARFRDQLVAEGATIHTAWPASLLDDEVRFARGDDVVLPPDAAQPGVRAQILWPDGTPPSSWSRIAEKSLVVRLSYGSVDFCFQGDVETAQETTLRGLWPDIDCEVHLVGHHGSRYASSAGWLALLDPEIGVVSFGRNAHGHPTAEALCRVQTAGATVYATHRAGNVTVETDGATFHVVRGEAETVDYCAPGADYWATAPEPAAPSSTATPPAPARLARLEVSVSDPYPCRYGTVTVTVLALDDAGSPVGGASVSSSWRYKTTTSYESGTTGSDGYAYLTRSIGSATSGHTVHVQVTAIQDGASASGSTSFTPQTC